MPYMQMKIGDLIEEPDRDNRGAFNLRLEVTEVQTRTWRINVTKADAARLQQMKNLKGKVAMVPCREGFVNGNFFMSLTDGDFIDLNPQQPAPKPA